MELDMHDKAAIITGGSRGIGFAVAEGLARERVHLLLCSRHEEEAADAAKRLGKEYGVRAFGTGADITKVGDITEITKIAHAEFGGADIVINNAGTGSAEKIMDAPDEKWQYYWDLFVMSAVRLSRAIIPSMKKKGGGVIINNVSLCAKQPLDYEPIYNTTKAALVMFTKCLANEVIKDNIRVNCINPGLVLTRDWQKTARIVGREKGLTPEEYLDQIAQQNAPIGRFASPEELANFFVFLCSPRASYCVGSSYYVDGGWLKVTV
jgi:NAD(P)-dependent dehydrogenase (short-subunit alcohol dehydrogenase family)